MEISNALAEAKPKKIIAMRVFTSFQKKKKKLPFYYYYYYFQLWRSALHSQTLIILISPKNFSSSEAVEESLFAIWLQLQRHSFFIRPQSAATPQLSALSRSIRSSPPDVSSCHLRRSFSCSHLRQKQRISHCSALGRS